MPLILRINGVDYQPWDEGVGLGPLGNGPIEEQSRGRKQPIFMEQVGQEAGSWGEETEARVNRGGVGGKWLVSM